MWSGGIGINICVITAVGWLSLAQIWAMGQHQHCGTAPTLAGSCNTVQRSNLKNNQKTSQIFTGKPEQVGRRFEQINGQLVGLERRLEEAGQQRVVGQPFAQPSDALFSLTKIMWSLDDFYSEMALHL
jgi:hypothetical protein